ncbi:MAG: hypothetical protein B7X46_06390 [Thiomonas sp. 15-66-11]|nr:MAG: hypothetical protein B7X46_06390 [Thiomonas sp. 15-66-11]
MTSRSWLRCLAGIPLLAFLATAEAVPLDLSGYAGDSGAISIQFHGDTVDPYFALQALLLAQQNGLSIAAYSTKWANWLLARQKPDATFDRFCRNGPVWAPCKTADADDSLLALWLKFLRTMPAELKRNPAWRHSEKVSQLALSRLVDPSRGIYLVSPVYQHGLFMDNLEVWSGKPNRAAAENAAHPSLAESIDKTFWDSKTKRFLVSTQPGQEQVKPAFYPDAVAQIYPLLENYPLIPGGAHAWYAQWIKQYRGLWLRQVHTDFAWGLVALVAWKQGDVGSARCWLRTTLPFRHTAHWTVTDEVVVQILNAHHVAPANKKENCT